MSVDKHIIILAGGSGSRMGSTTPKQFLEIGGEPILALTIQHILTIGSWKNIVVVLPQNQNQIWKSISARFDGVDILACEGGASRFLSVQNGLKRLGMVDGSIAIHDGVRPFVKSALVESLFAQVSKSNKGAIPVLNLVDSIREVQEGSLESKALDRSNFRAVQTPQVFPAASLISAYSTPEQDGFTDDASVFEAAGYQVLLLPGDADNIKITHPKDLALGGYILENWN
jgi:2-C-methyl-D-erythritol 4-phosphate cytidylyltransferase